MATILIAGGTGLIGSRLSEILQKKGNKVRHLSRKKNLNAPFPAYQWDINSGFIDPLAFEEVDYIINLAGAGIADKRWTNSRKKLILDSRIKSTLLLKEKIQALSTKPKAFIAASAIGFYGDRGSEWLDETTPPSNEGFLSTCCVEWEENIQQLSAIDMRLVIIRVGLVLTPKGGMLKEIAFPLKFRTNAYFGDGSQYYSWIHIEDICGIFAKAIESKKMEGTYNAVAPNPVTNKEITYAIKKAVDKAVLIMPAPAIALKLALGEMAAMILGGAKVSAKKIESVGYSFQFPDLLPALKDLLD